MDLKHYMKRLYQLPLSAFPRVYHVLNEFGWPEELGPEPEGLRSGPAEETGKTDKQIVWPLMTAIQGAVGEKALLRYHNTHTAPKLMDDQMFDDWWEAVHQKQAAALLFQEKADIEKKAHNKVEHLFQYFVFLFVFFFGAVTGFLISLLMKRI